MDEGLKSRIIAFTQSLEVLAEMVASFVAVEDNEERRKKLQLYQGKLSENAVRLTLFLSELAWLEVALPAFMSETEDFFLTMAQRVAEDQKKHRKDKADKIQPSLN